jgi:hypothetical protein
MKGRVPMQPASAFIDEKIKQLGDWRGKTLAKVREIIHQADPEILEEWKWVKPTSPGTPVFSHAGIVCTGETYKNVVKMTFAKGAALPDPSGLFNSSLDGNVRRAIDIHQADQVDEAALQDLIRAAVALNLKGKSKKNSEPKPKPKPRRASSKRAD